MPLIPVGGPGGGGKSGYIRGRLRPGEVVLDFSLIHRAISGAEPGDERRIGDPLIPLAAAIKEAATNEAIKRELSGYVTTSSREELAALERKTGTRAIVIDPGRSVVEGRLADPDTGDLSDPCRQVILRWYGTG